MRTILLLLALPLFAACADEAVDTGTITATVYGEELIEQGIPADAFSDGWSVTFDRFLVSIGEPKAVIGGDSIGDPGYHVVDLARPSNGDGYTLARYPAPAGTYEHYTYRLAPAQDATAINVEPDDLAAMQAGAYSLWVRGNAEHESGETRTFAWPFTLSLAYSECEMGTVIDGNDVAMQATIHADHLFYDDAVSHEPELAFQIIADADGADGSQPDGAVSLAELAATDIRAERRYQVGSLRAPDGSTITNLLQYIQLQATTVGHINGEGHCAEVIATP